MNTNTNTNDNSQLTFYNETDANKLSEIFKHLKTQHSKISETKTPDGVIDEIMGFDYVKLGYMKGIADKEFPGWSWIVIKYEAIGNQAFTVHGRLKWFDNGIIRTGDMVAGHRIQKLKDKVSYLNIGNDLKSANTDCLKKAFNTYMNICDDVYKKMFPMISIAKGEELLTLAKIVGEEQYDKINSLIQEGVITTENFDDSFSKLQKIISEKTKTGNNINTKESNND